MADSRSASTRWHLDGTLCVALLLLGCIGLLTLYSASGRDLAEVLRQGVRMGAGLALMVLVAQLHPDTLGRWSSWGYGLGLLLLVAVAVVGEGRGAQRWLDLGVVRFQPSEIMKLAVPMLAAWQLRDQPVPPSATRLAVVAVLILVPVLLVAEQPDLGTAVLIALSGAFVVFLSGLSWRFIGLAGLLAAVAAPLGWHLMHDYQRQRILTFLDPAADPLGSGYHIIQSQIAVGSGGVFGKGWLNGTQSHLDFLPERHTDFIFAVYCEEFGLTGVGVLMAVYAVIIGRALHVALGAQEIFGRLLAGSIALTFFIYVFVNMGMVVGRLPVVGVPLPLVSYGGTSLVTLLIGFGMVHSIHTHRRLLSH